MTALLNMPRAAWKRQPTGSVGLRSGFSDARCFLTGMTYEGHKLGATHVVRSTPMGYGAQIGLISNTTNLINPLYAAGPGDWTVLMVVNSFESATDYPYCLGLAGASVPYALSLKHAAVSYNATWYDGVSFQAAGVGVKVGETATIALSYQKSNNRYAWFKNGKPGNSYIGAYTGSGNWQFSTPASHPSTIILPLLYFKKTALKDAQLIDLTGNPWQLFKPRLARFILIPSSGGATTYTDTLSIDALIQRSGLTQSTTIDALLQSAFSRSLSLDGLIAAVQTGVISLDALLQIVGTRTVSMDALLQATKSGAVSVDALVQMTLAQSISLDALIVAASASSASVNLDALIQSLKTAGVSVDALLSKSMSAAAVIDALIQASKTGAVSLDAIITGASSASIFVGLDALIQAIQSKTLSVDALLQKAYTSPLALDAYVALTQVKTISLDALLQSTNTGLIGLDALIQMTRTVTVSFDALIQAAKTGAISLDAILVFATQASLLLDAYVQKTLSAGVGLDAIIGAIADMILPTGRVISVPSSDRWVMITHADRFIQVQ